MRTKNLQVVILSLIVFIGIFCSSNISRVAASQTLTLTPAEYGALKSGGITNDTQIYFISGQKSVAFFTFNPSITLENAKIESLTLRVKTHVVFDSNWVSAYRWSGSWSNYTWDEFTNDRATLGSKNCVGSQWMDQMDTWYTYTFSASDTIGNSLAYLPVTVHLESSLLERNFPETLINFVQAHLVVVYTQGTSAPQPTNNGQPTQTPVQTPDSASINAPTTSPQSQSGIFIPTEFIILGAIVIVLIIGVFTVIRLRKK